MSIRSATPRLLHADLVTVLRNLIIEGMLRPGDRIDEQRLCKRFGVSRTPLREAFKILSTEGLVSLVPNRGVIVSHLTRKELEELIPILGVLQALAGELACERIDDAGVARIRTMHEQMVDCYRAGDTGHYVELNRAIHFAIFAAADNQVLTDTHSILDARLFRIKGLLRVMPSPPRWAEAIEDHEQMVAALEARDGPALAQIARHHIRHKAEVVRHLLTALEEQMDAILQRTAAAVTLYGSSEQTTVSQLPAAPPPLHAELATWLRRLIFSGELRAGDHIDERRLCDRYGVSRTPLREAIKVLAGEGLVCLRPNRGTTVTRLTCEEVGELFVVIEALHGLAGELACSRIDNAGIARIRAMHEEMIELHRRGDETRYATANRAVHLAIFEGAGNAILAETNLMLDNRQQNAADGRWHMLSRAPEAIEEHTRIVEALEARDSQRLIRAVRDHVAKSGRAICALRKAVPDTPVRDRLAEGNPGPARGMRESAAVSLRGAAEARPAR